MNGEGTRSKVVNLKVKWRTTNIHFLTFPPETLLLNKINGYK